MRIEETFVVARPPEIVFDYMVDPANLAAWQTSKTLVEPLSEGPTRLGSRVRERTKPPGAREFEQIVEFTEFDRPHRFHVHVVEGPQPVDGTWTLAPEGDGTRVRFVAEGDLRGPMRLLGQVVARAMARQFAAYHRTLRANLEAAAVR
jgi:carbon monoxide dehydrogenase subunit G